jgi:ubiquinone/menaquinone biosynthesis C-methylase UbiE
MSTQHHYTAPSRLTRAVYRLVYDPLRAGYFRALVAGLGLRGTERVLDFGSGAGSEATYLADALRGGGRLTCLDVSPTWLAEARRRLRGHANVDFVLGEASDATLPAASFDLIVAHYVLHDVDRAALPATLAALAAALRPEGRFVVVEPGQSEGSRPSHSHPPLAARDLAAAIAAAGMLEVSREEIRAPFGSATQITFRHVGH